MMERLRPAHIILIGFLLVLTGFVLPLLMVIKVVESTFFLNFFSYTASTVGFFLGIIGASMYARERRKK
jgi:hypothetical protein